MSKKSDIKFDNLADFIANNPTLVVSKVIPEHVQKSPNYAAIRAILRSGGALEGVSIVEAVKHEPAAPAA